MLFNAGDTSVTIIVNIKANMPLSVLSVHINLNVIAMIFHNIIISDINAVITSSFLNSTFYAIRRGFEIIAHSIYPFQYTVVFPKDYMNMSSQNSSYDFTS